MTYLRSHSKLVTNHGVLRQAGSLESTNSKWPSLEDAEGPVLVGGSRLPPNLSLPHSPSLL